MLDTQGAFLHSLARRTVTRKVCTMKFCYFDESGPGGTSILVMAGVIVDASRMHITKSDWQNFLDLLSEVVERQVEEFHTTDFYRGNTPWRNMDGPQRAAVISTFIEWLKDRRHKLTFSAVEMVKYDAHVSTHSFLNKLQNPWCTTAMHCVLQVQKLHQRLRSNKGHTVLIFDREQRHETELTELVSTPPDCTHDYYNCTGNNPLSQVVDVPYFADSKKAVLIQVADMVAYIIRLYAELAQRIVNESYDGEFSRLQEWVGELTPLLVNRTIRYIRTNRSPVDQLFWDLAPDSLREL